MKHSTHAVFFLLLLALSLSSPKAHAISKSDLLQFSGDFRLSEPESLDKNDYWAKKDCPQAIRVSTFFRSGDGDVGLVIKALEPVPGAESPYEAEGKVPTDWRKIDLGRFDHHGVGFGIDDYTEVKSRSKPGRVSLERRTIRCEGLRLQFCQPAGYSHPTYKLERVGADYLEYTFNNTEHRNSVTNFCRYRASR